MATISPITSLREEHTAITLLLELLKQEQLQLVAADIDGLNQLTPHKAALLTQLSVLASQRHIALGACGFPSREEGMDAWLPTCDDASAAPLWTETLAMMREAKEMNRLNGMLINKHLVHTQGALNSLRPPAQSGNFYGANGQTTSNAASRRLVIG